MKRKVTVDRIDTERLSPQAQWALDHLLLPKVEGDLTDSDLAARTELSTKEVKRRLDRCYEEIRAQQEGATLPPASAQQVEALRESLQEHGLIYPIVKDERTGAILDGNTRLLLCEELGIRPRFTKVKSRDDDHAQAIALSVNLARRHLDQRRLRDLAGQELMRDPTRSDRGIAARLGVHRNTVGRARRELRKRGMVSHGDTTRVGVDGVEQPVRQVPESRYRVVVYGPGDSVLYDRIFTDLAELAAIDLGLELEQRELATEGVT